MLHLEMEKEAQKLADIQNMKATVDRISVDNKSNRIGLGSLVDTNLGSYFMSISAGQIHIDNKTYFAVSLQSPIGTRLLGKQQGDTLVFNGKKLQIYSAS